MPAIDEAEAQIVRQIFQWYTVGEEGEGPLGTYRIHKRLQLLGVEQLRRRPLLVWGLLGSGYGDITDNREAWLRHPTLPMRAPNGL